MPDNEKQFEQDIETFLISPAGGWQKASDAGYRAPESAGMALDIRTLTTFVKATQPVAWQRLEKQSDGNAEIKFYKAFENAVENDGLISVLRHGFKHRGIDFRVCYFKPESTLNDAAVRHYQQNICQCIRQWHYSENCGNSVDMMLAVNGIPVIAIELKNQITGQNIDNGKNQWMFDRDPKEPAFRLNHRILAFFAVDLYEAAMYKLQDAGLTYPCFCTRAELHTASAPHASDGTPIYRGACRGLSVEEVARRSALRAPATRLRVPAVDDLADDVVEFVDRTYGAQCEALATECGDFLVRRSDGVFAYQLAVVVDDAAMGVTEVVRGCDLLGSTPRQIYLQHLLGLPTPHYAHIPLLMAPDGRRLSKRDRDLDLGELRAHFGTPEALLGWLAGQTGIAPDTTPRTAEQLVEHFSWDVIRAHRENITMTAE